MKIVHLIESLGRGGAERRLVTDIALMDRSRFRSVVVHLFPPDSLKEELEALDVPVVSLGLTSGKEALRHGIPRLVALLKEHHPVILQSHLFWADILARIAGRWAHVPFICSIAQASVYEPVEHVYSPRRRWVDRLTGVVGCDGYIAVSHFVKQSHMRWLGIAEGRIRVIPNALDVETFLDLQKGHPDRNTVRRALALPEGARTLISVARMVIPKGQSKLLGALARLNNGGEPYHLLLVGEGPHRSRFEAQAEALGIAEWVHFLGVRRDVPALLAASDCFVLPSLIEGMPYALLEAMVLERPCVASSIGPHQEVIHDGESGWLVDPHDIEGLADTISDVFADFEAAQDVAKRGRQVVETRYNASLTVLELEDFYCGLIEKRSVRNGAR
ncbi:MAG: glycosyltransferase [bacterium]|nr:glycosyltransferase [bacterium]